MDQWAYKVLDSQEITGSFWTGKSAKHLEEYLNTLGAEGWEIINIDFRDTSDRMNFMGVAKMRTQYGPNSTLPTPVEGG